MSDLNTHMRTTDIIQLNRPLLLTEHMLPDCTPGLAVLLNTTKDCPGVTGLQRTSKKNA